MRRFCIVVVALVALMVGPWYFLGSRAADEKQAPTADEKGAQAAMAVLADGFNDGDPAKAAAAFTADAEYIDEAGNGVRSRAEIQKVLARYLDKNKGAKIQFTLDDARQVSPDAILQDGESVFTVVEKNSQSSRRYTVLFVRQDKKWAIASLREFPEESSGVENSDRIKELSWMIGEWVDESDAGAVTTICRWSQDKHYILRDFNIKLKGKDALSGIQRIGVDPLTRQLKGWAFDSENGHGETTWIKNGQSWLVKATGVTSDGEPASATYLFTPAGKDRIGWKTMHRVVGEQVLPDVEVTLVRKGPPPK